MGPLRCPWHLRCWGHDIEAVVVLVNIPRPSRGIRVSAGLRAPKILMPPPARASDIGCTRSADTWKRRVTQWCVGEPAGWGPPNVTGPAGRASACRGLPPVANSPMCDDVIAYPYAPKRKPDNNGWGGRPRPLEPCALRSERPTVVLPPSGGPRGRGHPRGACVLTGGYAPCTLLHML